MSDQFNLSPVPSFSISRISPEDLPTVLDCMNEIYRERPEKSWFSMDESQLSLVAHMEIAMVRSSYRGNGLQKKLMEAAEEQLRSAGFRWLMGTAHPDNVYSVHNFEQLGYKPVTKALKYGGLPRYIFCKKI